MRYHLYLILEDVDLVNTAALAYEAAMQREGRNKHEALLGDLLPLYRTDEKEGADDNVSASKISVEMTRERDENSSMHVLPDYSIRVPTEED